MAKKLGAVLLLLVLLCSCSAQANAKSAFVAGFVHSGKGTRAVNESTAQNTLSGVYPQTDQAVKNQALSAEVARLYAAFANAHTQGALTVSYRESRAFGYTGCLFLAEASAGRQQSVSLSFLLFSRGGQVVKPRALFYQNALSALRELVAEAAGSSAWAFGGTWDDYEIYELLDTSLVFYSNALLAKGFYAGVRIPLFRLNGIFIPASPLVTQSPTPAATPAPSLPGVTTASPTPIPTTGLPVITPGTPLPQYTGPTPIPGKPRIALTFDDGPYNANNAVILAALQKYNAHATFFVLGSRAESRASELRNIIAAGSEIGNHSYSHVNMVDVSVAQMQNEIQRTQQIIYNATGVYPRFFRPPYGSFNRSVRDNANMPFCMWTIDTEDWHYRDTDRLIQYVLSQAADGKVVLMHETYSSTAEAIETIVRELTARGYQLVTVSEMFSTDQLVNGDIYRHG